jgi:hypothetical protein
MPQTCLCDAANSKRRFPTHFLPLARERPRAKVFGTLFAFFVRVSERRFPHWFLRLLAICFSPPSLRMIDWP